LEDPESSIVFLGCAVVTQQHEGRCENEQWFYHALRLLMDATIWETFNVYGPSQARSILESAKSGHVFPT